MINISTILDAEALINLVNSAYRGETAKKGWTSEADLLDGTRIDLAELQALLQKPNTYLLKYQDQNGQIIGCVLLEEREETLYLGMLTVSPLLQNSGIGKKLLQEAELWAHRLHKPTITMTVINTRTELLQWYQRQGYNDTGKRIPFPDLGPAFGIPKRSLEFSELKKPIDLR